jgi:hypothetical protein
MFGPAAGPSSDEHRYCEGERPHVRRMKRSNTLVELKPAAAAISLIERSARVRSNVHETARRRAALHLEKLAPVRVRTTRATVWGWTRSSRATPRNDAAGVSVRTARTRANNRLWSYMTRPSNEKGVPAKGVGNFRAAGLKGSRFCDDETRLGWQNLPARLRRARSGPPRGSTARSRDRARRSGWASRYSRPFPRSGIARDPPASHSR